MTPENDERLMSVVYSSRAREEFADEALRSLLTESRTNNARRDVTGMLLYRGGRFVQILEGPESAVRDVMATITEDPRHTDVRVLIDEFIAERNFAEWTMGYEPIHASEGSAPDGFRDTFDDLESHADPSVTLRAARELSLWFRVRASRGL